MSGTVTFCVMEFLLQLSIFSLSLSLLTMIAHAASIISLVEDSGGSLYATYRSLYLWNAPQTLLLAK